MDRPTLEHLARLARLDLSAPERESLAADLAGMLAFFEGLSGLDTRGIEPSPQPLEVGGEGRPDEPSPGLKRSCALENAPDQEGGCFRVPPILGRKEEV